MASETIIWNALNSSTIRPYVGQEIRILVAHKEGRGWFGYGTEMTPDYIELTNGNQRQIINLFGNICQFTRIIGPDREAYGLGEPKLPI